MDLFNWAPIAALLNGASNALEAFIVFLTPYAGELAAVVAIIVLTMLVRAVLIPVGRSQVKAEWDRRRIAPKLQALQAKHKKNPQVLAQKTADLHKAEGVSQFAGILPALAQLPVISLVYALFTRATLDGQPNGLLSQHLFGAPLGTSFVSLLGSGTAWWEVLVYLALFAAMGVVAWFSRRTQLRLALPPAPNAAPGTRQIAAALSWMPFITIIFAAIVPLAATLYLVTTTTWTYFERILLRRRYWVAPVEPSGVVRTA